MFPSTLDVLWLCGCTSIGFVLLTSGASQLLMLVDFRLAHFEIPFFIKLFEINNYGEQPKEDFHWT